MKLTLKWIIGTEGQFVGHFAELPHIVAYGSSVYELSRELFKSMAIVADHELMDSNTPKVVGDGFELNITI